MTVTLRLSRRERERRLDRSRLATGSVRLHVFQGGAAVLSVCGALLTGCDAPVRASPPSIPPFVFVSTVDGNAELYRFHRDSIVRLTTNAFIDTDPSSAAGRLVFMSDRDGNAEIYIGDPNLTMPRRVTSHVATDGEPSLRPDGELIAFVSNRSGTPRIWIVDTAGVNPASLATGSQQFIPERAPVWSPTGDRIAFTSTRTGTSQVFVVAASGGQALQLSHEAGGAFDPVWAPGGEAILYSTALGPQVIKIAPVTGADVMLYAQDDRGIGNPACGVGATCLAVTDPFGANGDIVMLNGASRAPYTVLSRAADDRHPAIILP